MSRSYGKDYIDNPPLRAVTAEEVRGCVYCESQIMRRFLPRLLTHPGVSSTARAVIEAMLGGAQ